MSSAPSSDAAPAAAAAAAAAAEEEEGQGAAAAAAAGGEAAGAEGGEKKKSKKQLNKEAKKRAKAEAKARMKKEREEKERKAKEEAAAAGGAGDAQQEVRPEDVKVQGAGEEEGLTPQCPPLEGAVDGEVVTRFPPEPSGYLHIGHAKACILNDYYARHYNGRLIVRFDDTNPSKEKEEFEDNILKDLELLEIQPDVVSHTSDYFDNCQSLAEQLINDGLAYMDDTPREQMQEERMAKVNSARRDTAPAENLERFRALVAAETEDAQNWCLRAKIDMQSLNGTMRDPVLFRYNATPHHRTGTQYRAYPTYDLACPIVDSLEGVTHALRTTEYDDRNEQYRWLQHAMRLRTVHIHTFGRVNFIYTVLSKRKLTWFVENGYVDGWSDPRFPTIQGTIRRGVAVSALRDFTLANGASRRVQNMEWDVFWALNKKVYEPIAPRYQGVSLEEHVPLTVTNGPETPTISMVPIVPKEPQLGSRPVRLANRVFLEGQDASNLAVDQEVTLLRWGNVIIREITEEDGQVVALTGEFNPNGNFKKTKKLSWVADTPDLCPADLLEFDYLVTKATFEEGDNFEDFINPVSQATTRIIGDACLRTVAKGAVVQLERRGFFKVDRPYISDSQPPVLFMIPDGRQKGMSTLSGALTHR